LGCGGATAPRFVGSVCEHAATLQCRQDHLASSGSCMLCNGTAGTATREQHVDGRVLSGCLGDVAHKAMQEITAVVPTRFRSCHMCLVPLFRLW
jgi:hypothetical protein